MLYDHYHQTPKDIKDAIFFFFKANIPRVPLNSQVEIRNVKLICMMFSREMLDCVHIDD